MQESDHQFGMNNFRPYSLFLCVVVFFGALYFPTMRSFFDVWWNAGGLYGHGFLVFGIIIYDLWISRHLLLNRKVSINYLGLMTVFGLSTLWWLGIATHTLIIHQVAVYLILHVIIFTLFGFNTYRKLIFPLVFLLTAMPVWGFLQAPLRDISMWVTTQVLALTGLPHLIQGYLISMPGGRFLVEPACAGLGFVLVSIVLSCYYCNRNALSGKNLIITVVLAVVLSLLANWIRILTIVLVGNVTDMQHFIVTDHLTFGWLVYAVMLIPMFYFGDKYASPAKNRDELITGENDFHVFDFGRLARTKITIGLFYFVIAFMPVANFNLMGASDNTPSTAIVTPPHVADASMQQSLVSFSRWRPSFTGNDKEFRHSYTYGEEIFEVYIANYVEQTQNKELIYFDNQLLEKRLWKLVKKEESEVSENGNEIRFSVEKYSSLRSPSKEKLLLYFYMVAGETTSSRLAAKLLEAYGIVINKRTSSVVAISMDYRKVNYVKARMDLQGFAKVFIRELSI